MRLLEWARAQGCEWDDHVCREAASHGYLLLLQWARKQECPWDYHTLKRAAKEIMFDRWAGT